jgi:hypothetical protein
MSLTRDEWAMMWESIKTIERLTLESEMRISHNNWLKMEKSIKEIKEKIQQVIGQME